MSKRTLAKSGLILLACLMTLMPATAQEYASVAASVSASEQASTIKYLSSLSSRITGFEDCDKAAKYIEEKFNSIGLKNINSMEFPVVVPVEKGSYLEVSKSTRLKIQTLWPNLVNMSCPETLTGPIVYVGRSRMEDYNKKDLKDAIVLMEFNCGADWMNAFLLGAKAVIFIEPPEILRGEVDKKFLSIPINAPRYWISKAGANQLMNLIASRRELIASIRSEAAWEKRTGKNIWGFIPGTDPQLKKEFIMVDSFYDAISVVPSLAPGAEDACGISALLQIARSLKANPPARSVIILASSGHFQGLSGIKYFTKYWDEQLALEEINTPKILNLATKKPVKVSSREPSFQFVGGSAFDGKLNTRWSSAQKKNDNEWLMVDLKKKEKVGEIVINWDKDYAEEYAVETSLDGTSWETVFYTVEGKSGEIVIDFPQKEARYVKVQGYLNKNNGISISEMEIYSGLKPVLANVKFPEISMFISLDLSSRCQGVGLFYKGSFYDQNDADIKQNYSPLGIKLSDYAYDIVEGLSLPEDFFSNGINPVRGRSWKSFLPIDLAFNGEVMTLSGKTAITLATTNDGRPFVDTPLNSMNKVIISNLVKQTQFAACMISSIANDFDLKTKINLPNYNFSLKGKVVEFDPRVSYIPNTPVPGSIVVARGRAKTFTGVRGELIQMASDTGSFGFFGLASIKTCFIPPAGKQKVEAYKIDNSGNVIYAPDLGEQGAKAYPIELPMDWNEKEATVVVFPCITISIFDVVDQRFYKTFKEVSVYDGKTDCEPTLYGYSFPRQMGSLFQEPAAIIYMKKNEVLKVTMGSGLAGNQFTLLNSTETNPLGQGYLTSQNLNITLTPNKVTKDMWLLDEWRMKILRKRGIESNRLNSLHALALRDLTKADSAFLEKDYENFIRYSRTAGGFESRAYPDVRQTGNDVVKGVMFYMFLLLPFAFFLERLFFAFPDIRKQLVGTFAIFLIVFATLRYVHPAFDITLTPFMVLLAFITLALAVLVIIIILGKFDELFKEYKKRSTGVHTTDVGRISATATAFSLGVSNMRKRKGRTALTCATLILLTFTVLSFTSVRTFMSAKKIALDTPATYDGLMFRDRNWGEMEESTYKIILNEFGKEAVVSPRCWYYSTMVGNQSFIDIRTGEEKYTVTGISGMSPEEIKLSPEYKQALTGRWFNENDIYSCILPRSIADELMINEGASVEVFGLSFKVVGILDDEKMQTILDLDSEEVTPVNYLAMSQKQQMSQGGNESADAPPQKFVHLLPRETMLLPYSTLIDLGGNLRSIAIGCKDSNQVKTLLEDLMPRLSINLFVGENGKTYYASSIGTTAFSGLQNLFIPIIIAAFIILNTMLGSVYERVREIGIYSAIGLAPSHVAALFLAEACVYATVGSVSGYLLGQGISKIITMYNLLPGLTLNYSSVSATSTIGIVILMVILSSLYPANKASQLAVPSVERKWKLTEPEGDNWKFELPFTVTGEEAKGLNVFLKEFFDSHAEYSIGDFYTEGSHIGKGQTEFGESFNVNQMVWLAPFDLGVSQDATLNTEPMKETRNVYRIHLYLIRKSGDINSWKRTNTRFVNHLRKQLLLWRTLAPERRSEYISKFYELIN